jgi:hypothetical protein
VIDALVFNPDSPMILLKIKSKHGDIIALLDSGSSQNLIHPAVVPSLDSIFLKEIVATITLATTLVHRKG